MLKQLKETIDLWEAKLKTTEGKDRFIIKKALIEMRKDQYVIKNAYRCPVIPTKLTHSTYFIELPEKVSVAADDLPQPEGVSLMNPKVCEAILCNYSRLKQDSWDRFEGDTWYLIYDFERICDIALKPYPLYMRLIECKIDGMSNLEI